MRKLEDIPKKQIFNVPEDYFDKLPAQIQSRIAPGEKDPGIKPAYRYALQYALPLMLAVLAAVFYKPAADAESILASVETSELIYYLHDSQMSTEDLIENIDFNRSDLDGIENEVYDLGLKGFDPDELSSEMDLNTF